jgi:MFS family permease
MNRSSQATKVTYAGLFTVTLATLMYEVLLTRIFSVTMWYHFGFMAISLAMLGMTVGSIAVYRHPDDYRNSRLRRQMALSCLLFGLFALIGFLFHRMVPFVPRQSLEGVLSIVITYVLFAVPFFFSGICVSAALTKFPGQVSKLYAADLAGAASGCMLVLCVLKFTDGPTAVVVVATLASASGYLFAAEGGLRKLRNLAVIVSALFAAFAIANTLLVRKQSSLLRLTWTKAGPQRKLLFEKWNPFSRIAVESKPREIPYPVDIEGMSRVCPGHYTLQELELWIDAAAETTLTQFNGDWRTVAFLKCDVRNLAYYIRPQAKVLIVGAGGGRDILSALTFGQTSIQAIEFNKDIIGTANGTFGDFTGHLDKYPRVRVINDEARSYIARSKEQFDIIQISFIDTWAATAAGGLTLTENSLYTLEGWSLFLRRLTPQGVLSVSRWYFVDMPDEAYRLVSLASAALARLGVTNPREHILMVRNIPRIEERTAYRGAVTILLSRQPFAETDLKTVEKVAREMQFEMVVGPRFALDPTFATLASGGDLREFIAALPLNFAPPTDDQPFFFHTLRLRDAFKPKLWIRPGMTKNAEAVFVLAVLLGIVATLTMLFVIVPLLGSPAAKPVRGSLPHLIFFGAIGLGFMMVEISQMQRLSVFLGHPTYGLSVVLFVLLLAGGLGSYSTERIGNSPRKHSAIAVLILMLGVLMASGLLTPHVVSAFQVLPTPQRIAVATAILIPLGFVMGTAFPMGLKVASAEASDLTPWLWGINGATSVCGSVLAVAISLNAGISNTFWTGLGCYTVAVGAFTWAVRRKNNLC